MTDELVDKIRRTLEDGITQEKDLVYLLVEIRKLMDREDKGPKYKDPIIKSFSNWIVHNELSQKHDGTTDILKAFDVIVKIFKENASSKWLPLHFRFDVLQRQLNKLLKHYKLPTELTDDWDRWIKFMLLYASIVGDCPITFKASMAPLDYLQELELIGRPDIPDLEWKVTLKDNETSYFSAANASFSPPLKRIQP